MRRRARQDRVEIVVFACAVALLALLLIPNAMAALPDGRVWEQVSPEEKGAADIVPQPLRTRAAANGNAVQFISLLGTSDVRGGSRASEYISLRGEGGVWRTHGISPQQEPTSVFDALLGSFEPRYVGEFAPDLTHGIYMPKSSLSDVPNVRGIVNLYLRQNLLLAGAGTYELITDASSEQHAFSRTQPLLVGASQQLDRVYFESQLNLTDDSLGLPSPSGACLAVGACDDAAPKLYEWVAGGVRLVGILPGGEPSLSQAGQGGTPTRYSTYTISLDGTRAVFTAPPYDEGQHGGSIYVRDDHGTIGVDDDDTTAVNVSERTDCSGDPSCGGNGTPDLLPDPSNPNGVSQPAIFGAASSDAKLIFFTSPEQLTDDDLNHSADLYRANLSETPGHRLVRLSVDGELGDNPDGSAAEGHTVTGVLGASDDGSYVYFTARGQLVAGGLTGSTGGPFGGERIFVWHAEELREVGAVNDQEELRRILGGPQGWNRIAAKWSRITPDGSHLAFVTMGTDELLSLYGRPNYDHGDSCGARGPFTATACFEVYVYDARGNGGVGDLRCASCNPTGARAGADGDFYDFVTPGFGSASGTSHLPHVLSDDGRFVFFNSEEQLDPADRNFANDAYEYDTTKHQVHLLSAGTGAGDSVLLDASWDGQAVFFSTRDQLSARDNDQTRDLYVARVAGIRRDGRELRGPCLDEVCRGAPRSLVSRRKAASTVARTKDVRDSTIGPAVFSLSDLSPRAIRRWARHGRVRVIVSVSRPGRIMLRSYARIDARLIPLQTIRRTARHARTIAFVLKLPKSARRVLARGRRIHAIIKASYSQAPMIHTMRVVLSR